MLMSFPETVSDTLCRNSVVLQTDYCSSCLGGWSQTILEVKMLVWLHVVGCTAKFSETPLETAHGKEMNIQFAGNCSAGHSCS